MNKIKRLTANVVARIAAGEVIERPMNICKELVENSVDANSTSITVIIEEGGLTSVKVMDDGDGIPYEELRLAFDLHTTSKMETDDPSRVATLGFRGEALSSISAVSRVECVSRPEDQDFAGKVIIEGGEVIDLSKTKANKGTSIEIKGIFFNTPARRKFLKAESTERKRIIDLMTNYSLMYPKIHFKLDEILNSGNIKNRLETPTRNNMLSTVYDVLGADIAGYLIPIESQTEDWEIEGYISKPQLTRSDRSLQFISVNGRPVRHNGIQTTIEETYGSQLMRNTYPVVILKIDGPVDAVDFNVHPQKSEIRFRDSDPIFEELSNAVVEALSAHTELPELQKDKISRIKKPKIQRSESRSIASDSQRIDLTSESNTKTKSKTDERPIKPATSKRRSIQTSLDNEIIFESTGNFDVLGHIMNKFGLIYHENELWLVDIHAADERINFEKYAKRLDRNFSSQMFLQPLIIELPVGEKQLLIDHQSTLKKFGLRVEDGSDTSIEVHSMPVYYDQSPTPENIKKLLMDMLSFLNQENVERGPIKTPMDKIEYAIVSRLACHGAIRSGYPISKGQVAQVIEELLKCEFPWSCAHGRPTVLRMPKSKLEGWFKR